MGCVLCTPGHVRDDIAYQQALQTLVLHWKKNMLYQQQPRVDTYVVGFTRERLHIRTTGLHVRGREHVFEQWGTAQRLRVSIYRDMDMGSHVFSIIVKRFG